MKKSLLLSIVVLFYFLGSNVSFSNEEATSLDNTNKIESNIIITTAKYKVVEEDGKYLILDAKTGKNKLGIIADSIELFDDEFENEYKISFKNTNNNSKLTGYLNTITDQVFITNYDEMYLLGKYLKVKSNDKYGLIDKDGHTILMPIFDRVSVHTQDNTDYLSVKINGMNKLYYPTGNMIPDEELYSISYDGVYAIANDLKPTFKKFVIDTRNANYLSNSVYELKEVESIQNIENSKIEELQSNEQIEEKKSILLNKKEFSVVKVGEKLGLESEEGKILIPVEYDKLGISNLNKPIIIAEKNEVTSILTLKGKTLAEKLKENINVYKYGKVYTYTFNDEYWTLKSNNKEVGKLYLTDTGYDFVKNKFNLFKYNYINDLFIEIINTEK